MRSAGISQAGLESDMQSANDLNAPEDMQEENPEDQGQGAAPVAPTGTPAAPGIAAT